MLLNVPRISITIKCRRQTDSPQEAVATVVINKMSTWTEEYDELYDARFDSRLLDDRTYFNDGLVPCLFCGDPTVDIDYYRVHRDPRLDNVSCAEWAGRSQNSQYLPWDLLKLKPNLDRRDLCHRCNPRAVCENCRFDVDGKPVCIRCLEDSEVAALPASAQRRYGLLHVD